MFGEWLRTQYVETGFLPASWREGALAARTTNFARTKATLAAVLAGLFPDAPLADSLPAVTSSDIDEIMYADTARCPHLASLMKASFAQLSGAVTLAAATLPMRTRGRSSATQARRHLSAWIAAPRSASVACGSFSLSS